MSSYNQRRQLVDNLLSGLSYKERSAVQIQILQLLHQINSLRPQIDNYVFNDGTQQQLFKLDGTIPIQYRNNQYNIPVALWLPLNFPSHCPICYVTPVPGMKIKAKHMHVDSQGLIYHPYLHSWNAPNSNLVELIGLLCSVFGKDPPLYASKQKPSTSSSTISNRHANPNPNSNSNSISNTNINTNTNTNPNPNPNPSASASASTNISISTNTNRKQQLENELRRILQGIYDEENGQLNHLATAQKQLESHSLTINEIQSKQHEERELLLQRRQNLTIQIESTQEWLNSNENNDDINVDNVVMPSDTWSQQCMEAVAKEFAITDCMLELDKCLEDETIKLETYLKQVSKIAREQFAHKALAKAVFKKQTDLVQRNQSNQQHMHHR